MEHTPAPSGEHDTAAEPTDASMTLDETPALDPRSQQILAFEDAWSGRTGAKASAIRAEFAVSPARYYQMLSAVLDSPEALRHDPILIRRLQRVRDARATARAARSFRIVTQDPSE